MGCTDVCVDLYLDDENEFYVEKLIKSRKEHQCCECNRVIATGETYERVTGKSEGYIWTNATCAECTQIRKALMCGGWIFSTLWEEIEEHVYPQWLVVSPLDCLAKIDSPTARDKLSGAFEYWRQRNV